MVGQPPTQPEDRVNRQRDVWAVLRRRVTRRNGPAAIREGRMLDGGSFLVLVGVAGREVRLRHTIIARRSECAPRLAIPLQHRWIKILDGLKIRCNPLRSLELPVKLLCCTCKLFLNFPFKKSYPSMLWSYKNVFHLIILSKIKSNVYHICFTTAC